MTKKETVFTKDLPNKTLKVVRAFDAPIEQVWKAWTEADILDQWWAPRPYRAETKSMDFRPGGMWFYAMVSPDNVRSWCKESYKTISLHKSITNTNGFCDESGKDDNSFPVMNWKKEFSARGAETTVSVDITFDSEADLDKIIAMGFKEGFTAGLGNLEEYLNGQTK